MASALHKLAANFRSVIIKAAAYRLSDTAGRATTDYAEILCGDGVPSGAYGRDSGATLVYLRKDASSADETLYVSHNGGTAWNAVEASGLTAALLASTSTGEGASLIGIEDAGTLYTETTVEGALGEVMTAAQSRVPTAQLASTGSGAGASLVGIEDTGGLYTATDVEDALAEVKTIADAAAAAADVLGEDYFVLATVAVADASGGATDSALTLSLAQATSGSDLASARRVLLYAFTSQYMPGLPNAESSVSFGTATTGSIVASGPGWAIVETDSAGDFACTVTNTDDEALYFAALTQTVQSDPTKACVVINSNSDVATWSA